MKDTDIDIEQLQEKRKITTEGKAMKYSETLKRKIDRKR